jgi:hypothetical protein
MYRDGVPDEDRKRLYQHARLGLHEMDAVNNLVYMGVNVNKVPSSFQTNHFHVTDPGLGLWQET